MGSRLSGDDGEGLGGLGRGCEETRGWRCMSTSYDFHAWWGSRPGPCQMSPHLRYSVIVLPCRPAAHPAHPIPLHCTALHCNTQL